MPIVDIEFVRNAKDAAALPAAGMLAAAMGRVFGTPASRTWVRIRTLDDTAYAENDAPVAEQDLPVFVTILHAHPPVGAALVAELAQVTKAVADCCSCASDRVHVQYAPAAAGRQAFGGKLVH